MRGGTLNFILLVLCWLQTSTSAFAFVPTDEIVEWSGTTMGDIGYKVIVVNPTSATVDNAEQRVSAVLQRLDAAMSTYQPESEVSRFNNSLSIDWFPVCRETALVVAKSLEISRHSEGAFDITVKPLVELWNFGAGRGEFAIPDDAIIDAKRTQVGFEKLQVQLEPPMIRKSQPDVQIDLSAIAKGFIVDEVSRTLLELGFNDHFVEIGGEVVSRGYKPQDRPWRVGIERPVEEAREIQIVLQLANRAVATSGDYRNFAIVDGRRYSHAIDPKTGRPVLNNMASATIIAEDCMTADAIATAVMVLGQERGTELCKTLNVEWYGLVRSNGTFVEFLSPGFQAIVAVPVDSEATNSIWPVLVGSLVFFLLAVGGLLLGVLFANKPIRGSCGGMSAITGDESSCNLCGNGAEDCVSSSTTAGQTTVKKRGRDSEEFAE
jgi:thiamine biosynthesis lipoprotein